MIEVKDLCRSFGSAPNLIQAVRHISFRANPGDVMGLLGPNGAGKSTTIKIITGFLSPTAGQVLVNGMDVSVHTTETQKLIGYMPENAPLYGDLTVREFLEFTAEMRNVGNSEKAIQQVAVSCQLESVLDQIIETLSKGYKRRVCLAQALIHDPQYLILDEPTDGLDPNQKFEIRKLIRSLAQNKVILLSTHILEEVDALCNRVVILSGGAKQFDGSLQELKDKSATRKLDDVFRAYTTRQAVQGVQL